VRVVFDTNVLYAAFAAKGFCEELVDEAAGARELVWSDDVVLATALAGKADVIVTGDDDLLVLKEFRGIRILSPRQFLQLLDRR
jgi:predicted nucleic acid-binding protein